MRCYLLAGVFLLSGCATYTEHHADGFRNIQVTVIPAKWNRPGQTFVTTCLANQMAKASDGKYYCPPDHSVESLKSQYHLPYQSPTWASLVVPAAIQGAALVGTGALIMHGLQTQAVSPASPAFPDARISTFNTFGQAPVGFVR